MADDDNVFDIDPDDFQSHDSLGDVAKMGMSVYRALKRDGATESEAFTVTAAWFAGTMKAVYEDDEGR